MVTSYRTPQVNGHSVSLPHILPSGVSLSLGVTQDKSEAIVVLRRDAGKESELEVDVGVTIVTVKLPLWYSGKLCGLCGNHNALHSDSSVESWVSNDFPVWYVINCTASCKANVCSLFFLKILLVFIQCSFSLFTEALAGEDGPFFMSTI